MTMFELFKAGGATINLNVTSRHGFVAPPDHILLSLDFSAQEIYVVAVLSGDIRILNTFLVPEYLPLLDPSGNPVIKDGQEVFYKNPAADLHTITCKECCFPELFVGKSEHQWVDIAKDKTLIKQKGTARDFGKKVNFGIVYGQTAKAMSDLYHVPEKVTAKWLERHEKTYPQFHRWAKEIGHLCTHRGWSRNPAGGIRWVGEDNAKAQGASPARSGVNFQIQGFSAMQIKMAQRAAFFAYQNTKARLGMLVHDELVSWVPGRLVLDEEKCKYEEGIFVPYYRPDEEGLYWANVTKKCMEDAQTESFKQFEGDWKGRAEASLSRIWAH